MSSKKQLKTCLRYPGGKSRAVKYLLPKFPKDITEYREPFLGGGSVAIAFTKRYPDVPVWVNDLYNPLYLMALNSLSSSVDFNIDDDATSKEIGAAFTQSLAKKGINKKMLTSFASLIS